MKFIIKGKDEACERWPQEVVRESARHCIENLYLFQFDGLRDTKDAKHSQIKILVIGHSKSIFIFRVLCSWPPLRFHCLLLHRRSGAFAWLKHDTNYFRVIPEPPRPMMTSAMHTAPHEFIRL
jgi:hypothetical protein